MMTDLSITIVAYNNEEDVTKAVCSIMEHTALSMSKKIYLVDNSTHPNTLSALENRFPEVTYIKMERNLGFGRGHNQVLPLLDSKYHAIVNPDIILTEDSFSVLVDFLNKNAYGMVIPKLLDTDGNLQAVYRRELTVWDMFIRFFLKKGFKKRKAFHTLQDMDFTKSFPVPFAQGSFLVVRTALFKELEGFDERFFMYVEDADLCKRVNACSSLYYCPDTAVIHKWEKGSHKDKSLRKEHIRSMFLYFNKWGWKLW